VSKTKITAEPGKQEFFITREFDAPRELVFKAHTDPKLYAQWLGPRRFTMKLEKFEPRSGGMWRYISKDKAGNEYGAVTGRPRRCGWFDAPLLRYTAMINGFDSLVVTKLDVLDEFEQIRVCVGYKIGGQVVCDMPATVRELEKVEAVYECLPGWNSSTFGMASYGELPALAKDYLAFLEERTGVEVGCISTGPERNQTIVRAGSRFEKLIG